MDITFFAVGDGDCICLEWIEKGVKRIGIVDCHRSSLRQSNPIIERLVIGQYSRVEFVLLTHPHNDHYSGLREILLYCEEKSIHIRRFLHSNPRPLEYTKALLSYTAKTELDLLYSAVIRLEKASVIGSKHIVNDFSRVLSLGSVFLKFLAPSETEMDKFRQKIFGRKEDRIQFFSRDAHLICVIMHLSTHKEGILLTADSEKSTLLRIRRTLPIALKAIQVPHHGSKHNYPKTFWQTLHRKPKCDAVISASGQDKHPSPEVIKHLSDNGYTIKQTNTEGPVLSSLDLISTRTRKRELFNDVVVTL